MLAGAGSGKTSVVTHKLAWLVRDYGLAPRHIAALTGSNKAARAMKTCAADLLSGDQAKALTIGTAHALGLNILRSRLKDAGHRPGFSIYDAEESRALLAKLLAAQRQQAGGKDLPAQVQERIALWKRALTTPEQAQAESGDQLHDVAARIYGEYEQRLRAYNALDLDDLILRPVRLLQEQPEILAEWRKRIQYLLVDDYQDASVVQHELVKLLVGERGGLTVAGDDDQSAPAGRGARPPGLKRLQQDYPRLKLIRLEQNYRSTGRILKAANALIAHNPRDFEKTLWCELDYGEPMRVFKARREEHEAELVVADLLRHKLKTGANFRDYAILAREPAQARVFERALRERRIPYFLGGVESIFDKTEIKDVLAYLRLLCNPDDDQAFLRVVNTPRREIGPATLEQLAQHAAELGVSLVQASLDDGLERRLGARQLAPLRAFTKWAAEAVGRVRKNEPVKIVSDVIAELHYEEWLRETCNDDKIAARRMESILELVNWLQRLARQSEEKRTLGDLIGDLSLIGYLEQGCEENPGNCVALMTLHAARGMEFQHVYMAGMEEGLLPHRSSLAEPVPSELAGEGPALEGERRLAYIGVTRAQTTLTFSYAEQRRRGGEIVISRPSRFLHELPLEDLCWEEMSETAGPQVILAAAEERLAGLRTIFGPD